MRDLDTHFLNLLYKPAKDINFYISNCLNKVFCQTPQNNDVAIEMFSPKLAEI